MNQEAKTLDDKSDDIKVWTDVENKSVNKEEIGRREGKELEKWCTYMCNILR